MDAPTEQAALDTLQALLPRLEERGEAPALMALARDDIRAWSGAELARAATELARGLADAGLASGDNVVLLADNRPEWVVGCLAVIAAGGVVVPVDSHLGDRVLAHILADSAPRFVLTTAERVARLAEVQPGCEERAVLLDAGDDPRGWQAYRVPAPRSLPQAGADDPAALFYTSGTTGPPKGVPLTHANLVFQIETLRRSGLVGEDERVLLPLPLHHVYPFVMGLLTPLALGVALVLPHALTGPQIVRALRDTEATILIGVPRLYQALYDGIRQQVQSRGALARAAFDATLALCTALRRRLGWRLDKRLLGSLHRQFGPSLRVLASGGAALPPELARRLQGLGWDIAIGYGLTETAPLLTIHLPWDGPPEDVGRPVPGVELRIDTDAAPGGARGEGEVLARGPNVFAGYRGLADQTAEAFTRDGWFRTGDIGYLDAGGRLHITGRLSTLIVTEGGKNIQPDEVEAAYEASPVIREVGVLGEDGRLVALIVPETRELNGAGEDAERVVREAVDAIGRRLPSYQRLSRYLLTRESLPRTRLGKVQRHRLAERYREAQRGEGEAPPAGPLPLKEMSGDDRALLENPNAARTWEWLAHRYRKHRLTPDTSPQLDLGVDSMEWLNITLELRERVGVELDEEAVARIYSVRDLLSEVAQADKPTGRKRNLREHPEHGLTEEQRRWMEPLGPAAAALARFLYGVVRVGMVVLFRLRVRGREHIPSGGPCLITPNHTSYLDPFALCAAMRYRQLRQLHWAGWAGVISGSAVTRFFSRLAQAVPIDPQSRAFSSLAVGATVLKRGQILVWFPEGQRSLTGELQPLRPGIGVFLENFEARIVPVFIAGAYEALPPQRTFPRLFRPISVSFGPALSSAKLAERGRGETRRERILDALQRELAALGEK